MTPLFHFEFLNHPFGDPALLVNFRDEKRSLLFDIGNICHVRAGKLFRVTSVFVSHTHIDHFTGFDHLIRLNLARDKTLCFYGHAGITDKIRGKLSAYTWNLVGDYPFVIHAMEIDGDSISQTPFICKNGFKPGETQTSGFNGVMESTPNYTVKTIALSHGNITTLAFSLQETFHININREKLLSLGLPVGRWLRELKDLIWAGSPEDRPVLIPETDKTFDLGYLKETVTTITRGQKIVYVADCCGNSDNMDKIVAFASQADILFCEAAFLDEDRDKARQRGHLTAKQAGAIARECGAAKLKVFHFSPRYEGRADLLYDEAERAFKS